MKTIFITAAVIAGALSVAAVANDIHNDPAADAARSKPLAAIAKTNPISTLPAVGTVSVSGTVTSVDFVDNEFTVQDRTGASIDVETQEQLNVEKGDEVAVKGKISDDMGEKEISATNITVIASNETASSSHERSGSSSAY